VGDRWLPRFQARNWTRAHLGKESSLGYCFGMKIILPKMEAFTDREAIRLVAA
jgi:hypothetical protein